MTAKAKPKHPAHSVTTVHGNTRITVTKQGHTTTTTKTVKHGGHRVTTTTVVRRGKVIRSSRSVSLITRSKARSTKTAKPKKRGAPGPLAERYWVTGGNDVLATCVPVALANSRLLVTGYRVEDWQVLALAGERTVADCLAGLGVAFREAECLSDGVIVGLPGEHAGVWHDGAVVSWGAEISLEGLAVEEAWEVDWRQAASPSSRHRSR